MKIWIVPATNAASAANALKSLEAPISRERLARCGMPFDEGRDYYAWGAVAGPRNRDYYAQMQAGDYCLFYTRRPGDVDSAYNWFARVNQVVGQERPELGTALWDDPTFSLVYFLHKPQRVRLTRHDITSHLSKYRQGILAHPPLGFYPINQEVADAIQRDHHDIEEWLLNLSNTPIPAAAAPAITTGIPDGITRQDILDAIDAFEGGITHSFGPSSFYDLLHEGKRYPPKAIIGIAAKRLTGRILDPNEFSGGESSKCFRVLRSHGFMVVLKQDPLRMLPENKPENVFIEITTSTHKHGGEGWEYGTCCWCPSRDESNPHRYEIMKVPAEGDLIIHIYDSVIDGFSIVKTPCREVMDEPPSPGSWGRQSPYYRIDLEGFTKFEKPKALGDFIKENANSIESDIDQGRPLRYPFQLDKNGSISTVQGSYFNSCTETLYGLIRDAVTKAATAPKAKPYSIDDALNGVFVPRREFERMLEMLRRKKNIILEGAPGVGKTFIAKRLAKSLIGFDEDHRIEMVQFHQSYAYEDFIQGYRPKSDGGFERKDGVFYRFCDAATPDGHYVFVIDEINRANLSKVLGEVMMLIEADKRGEEFGISLTYSNEHDKRFSVPDNVYLIGLMNTADRSLSMVDYALRRRFSFFSLQPQFETEAFRKHLAQRNAAPELIQRIRMKMATLNAKIKADKELGEGYQIGHSFFCPCGQEVLDDDWYRSVIDLDIAPLIREYWSEQRDEAQALIDDLLT